MKKEIKVEVKGKITNKLIDNFNKRLAVALILQYGRDGAMQILKGLKGE